MADKVVIGLTGHIASGKSIILRMMQELGASTIDADKLVHQLMQKGTPVYQAIVEEFGRFIVDPNTGQINRKRLGQIAFSLPEAMEKLESLTHPAVRERIRAQVANAPGKVVAVEAIKLFESGLAKECSVNWVVTSKPEVQLKRLVEKRRMPADQAKQRIRTQMATNHNAQADAVIDNSGELAKTWMVVKKHFVDLTQAQAPAPAEAKPAAQPAKPAVSGAISLRRAKRGDLDGMAALIASATGGKHRPDVSDMMEALFSLGFMVAESNGQVVGMAGWQTENLVAGLQDFYVVDESLWPTVGTQLLEKVHEELENLSCEVSLVFVLEGAGQGPIKFFESHEYELTESKKLGYIWKDAAKEWQPEGSVLLYKKLREQRIMVPM